MKLLERISVLNWFTRIGLALVGGLSSSLAFPRENLSPIIIVSVVALFLSVHQLKVVPAFAIGLVGGLSFYLSQIEWMSLYLGTGSMDSALHHGGSYLCRWYVRGCNCLAGTQFRQTT
jgi:apolipoprotein N-acyltransferase